MQKKAGVVAKSNGITNPSYDASQVMCVIFGSFSFLDTYLVVAFLGSILVKYMVFPSIKQVYN